MTWYRLCLFGRWPITGGWRNHPHNVRRKFRWLVVERTRRGHLKTDDSGRLYVEPVEDTE